jgi:16S rRNA (cytidine1402-2'-O)-methyltransferase
MASLYIVGTPIGNLEDITLRALTTLQSVDFILCEDTRMTKRLLQRHNILKPTKSYHAHSKESKVKEIIALLVEGKNLALVTDAGTPGISDPGASLVGILRQELRDQLKTGEIKIEAIPGPSALTTAISVAGVDASDFTFLGFLPHKKGRETIFREIATSNRTMIFYESPHRIMKTLESLEKFEYKTEEDDRPNKLKKVTICRELTKIFEEVAQGTASEVKQYFLEHPDKVKGEFVVIVS